jgi:microcystin-dependent protein
MWGGAIASPPDGWLICDGTEKADADYVALSAIIKGIYGTDAGTDFTLPNFTNKFPYGANEGSSAGNASVGSKKTGAGALSGNDSLVLMASSVVTGGSSEQDGNDGTTLPQMNHTHDAMPPYLAVAFIIKT